MKASHIIRWGIAVLLFSIVLVAPLNVQAQSTNQVTAEQVQAQLPALEKYIQEAMTKTGVPGVSIAVVYQDQVLYMKGFGVREAGKTDAVTEDTVFQLASLSKPVGATVIASLVSDGIVSWDAKISDLDPAFQMHDPWVTSQVTVRDLYSHRSGLPGNAGNDLEELGFTRDQILPRLRFLTPVSSFRSAFAYSNFGMTEGGTAAVKPTGKTWEENSQVELYTPLGMTHTTSLNADFLKETNVAKLHIKVDGKWTAKLVRQPDAQSPAGGVSSTANDMAQWLKLQIGKGKFNGEQLIQEPALLETHNPVMYRGIHPLSGNPNFYALGWGTEYDSAGRTIWTHNGAFSTGARTIATIYPNEQLGIVILANAFPTGLPEAVSASFFDLVYDGKILTDHLTPWENAFLTLLDGPAAQSIEAFNTPPSPVDPPLVNDAYVGTYANAYWGNITVTAAANGLVLTVGPDKMQFPLKHWDRDTFLAFLFQEIPDAPSPVTFTIGADGKATQIYIEGLDSNGAGTLKRAADAPTSSVAPTSASTPASGEFAGLVDIGNGRKLYMQCAGTGSPTVLLEAGLRNRGDIWSTQVDPTAKTDTVFFSISQVTHVCEYDRPGTTLDADQLSRSDAVPMPRTVQDAVADLRVLLTATKIPAPYVLVGHSTGGMIVRLFATEYPKDVAGMVWVDALPEDMAKQLSPADYATFVRLNQDVSPVLANYKDYEVISFDASFDQMRAAKPLQPVPLVVLSRGVPTAEFPGDVPKEFGAAFEKAWQVEQNRLVTLIPNATNVIATKSGHYIQIEQPELVIDAIEQVVQVVQSGKN